MGTAADGKGLTSSLFDDVKKFYEIDTRKLGTKLPLPSDSSVSAYFFEIPTPAWFPDSFLRSIKRNNYLAMVNTAAMAGGNTNVGKSNIGSTLSFYTESGGNALGNLVKSAVEGVISTISNQIISITSKVDSILSGISNIGKSTTNSTSDAGSRSDDIFLVTQPYMNIYGIHLTEALRDTITSFQNIISSCSSLMGDTFNSKIKTPANDSNASSALNRVKTFFQELQQKTGNALASFILNSNVSGMTVDQLISELLTNEESRLHGMAESVMDAMVSGTYTMTCKLPFFGNGSPIMASCGDNSFMGIGQIFNPKNGLMDGIKRATGLNAIWSSPLEWEPSSLSRFTPVDMSFDIFNDTLEHVMLNLMFIWSFGATSKAVTDALFIRPPYIYNIEVPGGFRYKYCTCKFAVTPRGKMRKLSNNFNAGNVGELFEKVYGYKVNPKSVEYVPDFYRVQLSFTSILPDLWNYMDTYLHNQELDTVTLGKHITTKLAKFVENF